MQNESAYPAQISINIRLATSNDTENIAPLCAQEAAIQQQLAGYQLTPGYDWANWVASTLTKPGHWFYVAEYQNQIFAYIYGRLKSPRNRHPQLFKSTWFFRAFRFVKKIVLQHDMDPPCQLPVNFNQWGIIESLFVIEPERRQGIARALVNKLQHELYQHGVTTIEISVNVKASSTLAFWQTLGYETVRLQLLKNFT